MTPKGDDLIRIEPGGVSLRAWPTSLCAHGPRSPASVKTVLTVTYRSLEALTIRLSWAVRG